LSLPLSLILALLSLSTAMFAEPHGTKVVLAATTRRTAPAAELAAAASMTLRAAVVVTASVVQ
jgi:hypothetical protein